MKHKPEEVLQKVIVKPKYLEYNHLAFSSLPV